MRRFNLIALLVAIVLIGAACGNTGPTYPGSDGAAPDSSNEEEATDVDKSCQDRVNQIGEIQNDLEEIGADDSMTVDEKQLAQQPLRQQSLYLSALYHDAGCAGDNDPIAEPECTARGAVVEYLLDQGFERSDFVFEEDFDLSLPGASDAGSGAFAGDPLQSRDTFVPWYNSDDAGAVEARQHALGTNPSLGESLKVLSGENHVGVQFLVPIYADGNTLFDGGGLSPSGSRRFVPEGDIWWLFVDPDSCEVDEDKTVRGPCGNPQTEPPKPMRRRVCFLDTGEIGSIDTTVTPFDSAIHGAPNDPACDPPDDEPKFKRVCVLDTGNIERINVLDFDSSIHGAVDDPRCNPEDPKKKNVCVLATGQIAEIFVDDFDSSLHGAVDDPRCNPEEPEYMRVCVLSSGNIERILVDDFDSSLHGSTSDPRCNPEEPEYTRVCVLDTGNIQRILVDDFDSSIHGAVDDPRCNPEEPEMGKWCRLVDGEWRKIREVTERQPGDLWIGHPYCDTDANVNEETGPGVQDPFVNEDTEEEVNTPDPDPEPPLQPEVPLFGDENGDGEITEDDLPPINPPLEGDPDVVPDGPGSGPPTFGDA